MRKSLLLVAVVVASTLAAACTAGGGSDLTGKTWFLTSGSQTNPAWQWVVPPPDSLKYTITFNADKTFSATADCNQVSGTYETSGSNGLTIKPGPSTLAYCGEGSLGSLYTTALATTESYKVDGNTLTLTLKGGGTMNFASAQPAGSAAPPASPPEVSPGAASGQGLTGKEWRLTAMTEKVPAFQGVVPEAEQANYTITFADDKTFTAKADCNNVAGTYDTDDPAASAGRLTITPGPTTLVACPEGSLGDLFVIGL
ncbi:MAG TPA: META domain-containing protein, partial [Candidatus Limnocylindrales bacterium]|nr:META domain-containing protein [Candidatus Limnocylindrales bacterium]